MKEQDAWCAKKNFTSWERCTKVFQPKVSTDFETYYLNFVQKAR